MTRVLRAFLWLVLPVTFLLTTVSAPLHLPGISSDAGLHVIAFAVLTALALGAYPQARIVEVALWLILFGAVVEVAQGLTPTLRNAEFLDFFFDVAAVAVVCALFGAIRFVRRIRTQATDAHSAEVGAAD